MWSFDRLKDSSKIITESIVWNGPFSWPGFEIANKLKPMQNVGGVYIFAFKYKEGYLLSGVGITNSTKRRIAAHTRAFRKGEYTILDVKSAESGVRNEIWHGWQYAKTHQEEFTKRKDVILVDVEKQLEAYKIFIAEVPDIRKRERIEASIMYNIYVSKEPWSELVDRGMFLKGRYTSELPIKIKNNSSSIIYGLPEMLEI